MGGWLVGRQVSKSASRVLFSVCSMWDIRDGLEAGKESGEEEKREETGGWRGREVGRGVWREMRCSMRKTDRGLMGEGRREGG